MDFSFDPEKNARNIVLHGISFERAAEFEWSDALIIEDTRRDYGERRYQALGCIEIRLHMLIFTRRLDRFHVISLRKANKREERRYAKENQTQTPTNGS